MSKHLRTSDTMLQLKNKS